jgi:cell volume regulation protein A
VGVAAAFAAARASVPVLVAFLGLGMLLGSDGPGGIEFDDPELARTVGVAGLVAILFEGGLTTSWRDIRPIALPAALLSTVGVVVTALVTGAAAYALFDLTLVESLLLGAVVGSTDAAAVFSTLRFTTLRRRTAGLLEAESGANDPMAVALTLGLIAWVTEPGYAGGDLALLLVRQLGVGLVAGCLLGAVAMWALRRLPLALAPFAPVLSLAIAALAFGATDVVGGSGFLAVYVVGLAVGNSGVLVRESLVAFHGGVAFLAQVILFVVLGLLVFPSRLGEVVVPGLVLALALALVARPVAVWLSLPFARFGIRERTFVSWAGLRGAVPIVLATFVQSADLAESETIFNAVFFVVLVSALIQGPTLEPLARRLGLATERRPLYRPPLEVGAVRALGADLLEFPIDPGTTAAGRAIRDLPLPRDTLVVLIVRGDEAVPPRGETTVEAGDQVYVLVRGDGRAAVERLFADADDADAD